MQDIDGFGPVMGLNGILVLVLVAAICAVIYLLRYCHAGPSAAKSVIKTASVGLLAMAACFTHTSGWLLSLALALCALGDFLLSREDEPSFLGGVAAFAAGHLAYVALFLTHWSAWHDDLRIVRDSQLNNPLMPWIAGALVLFGLVMMGVLFRKAGALRWPVMGYVPVIVTMALASFAIAPVGGLALVTPAAFAFMLSDTVLAAEMFLLPAGHRARRFTPFIVWGFYWIAQFGFFAGLGWIPVV